MTTTLAKVAMIRQPGYPVGQPAPMYLNCPCGAKPPVPDDRDADVLCACGTRYTYNGYRFA